MYKGKKIAVVIPAYNEQELIQETLNGIPDLVDGIYVVDDCSTDMTRNKISGFSNERISLICHNKNMGVGAAIKTGYTVAYDAGFDIIVVMAGDNQMDPRYITNLVDPLINNECDYTKGNRLLSKAARKQMPKFRIFGNSMLSFLTKVSSGFWDIVDPQNGYTAVTRQSLDILPLSEVYSGYGYPNDLLIKMSTYNLRVKDVVIPARYGLEKSKIFLPSYILHVSKLLVFGFVGRLWEKYVLQSLHPLIFFYLMSFLLIPLGLISGIYILYLRIVVGGITAASVLLPVFLLTMGVHSLFFAMFFDMQNTKK